MKSHPQILLHKFRSLSALSAATLLSFGTSLSAATWNGATADWKTNNWGLGAGAYPGDGTNVTAIINSGNVTIGSALPGNVGEINVQNATLNIEANLSSSSGNSLLFQGNTTVNHTAGAFAYTGFQTLTLGYNTAVDNVQWSMSAGSFSSSQRGISFGREGDRINAGTIAMDISGSSSISVARDIRFNAENATMNIDASVGVTVQVTGNNFGIRMDSTNLSQQTINYNARLEVSGYNASTSLNAGSVMNLYQGQFADGSNAGGSSSVVAFTLDNNPNGVNAWTATTINLGNGTTNVKGDLEVDVSALAGAHAIKLFGYTTLTNGSFGNVDVFTGSGSLAYNGSFTGTDPNTLGANEYYLAYGDGSNDQITLYYNVIPEPSAAMVLLSGIGMLVMRRRRA